MQVGGCGSYLAEKCGLQLCCGVAGVKKLTKGHLQRTQRAHQLPFSTGRTRNTSTAPQRPLSVHFSRLTHRWRYSLVSDPEDGSYQANVSQNH